MRLQLILRFFTALRRCGARAARCGARAVLACALRCSPGALRRSPGGGAMLGSGKSMSLIGHVYLLADERVQALLAEPALATSVIDGAYNDPGAGFVDLDKGWQCLHYLLTGSARDGDAPLNFLLKGGTPVGDEDSGFGPARVFRPLEVAVIADALSGVTQPMLLSRFELKKLEKLEIYPGRWSEVNMSSDYDLGYYLGPFEELKRVAQRAKNERLGMIVWIA